MPFSRNGKISKELSLLLLNSMVSSSDRIGSTAFYIVVMQSISYWGRGGGGGGLVESRVGS